jgi:threonine synthase
MSGDDVAAIRRVMGDSVHTDDEVREAIVELDRRYGYLADPHTAIAYLGARQVVAGCKDRRVLFLSTAHPAKFGEVVEPIVGRTVPLPAPLAAAIERPRMIARIEPALDGLAAILLS